ncbi:hypothetical protein [Azospirillum sp. sgz301742]
MAAIDRLTPATDVIEFQHALEIMVELPGLGPDEVEVAISSREVIVSAVVRHVAQRQFGAVQRAARARMENGLLVVALPISGGHVPRA